MGKNSHKHRFLEILFLCMGVIFFQAAKAELLELSLEELMGVEVSSVSKKLQSLSSAPAAIYVLTSEDIRSSGATSIPDALRMVPGMQVAKMDANKWAISARGFNSRFANKMLVLMDGRSLYTPSFGGIYWELQHTLLEDIERIEVIRGPSATLWGSNAVNGVINIITKSSADTKGSLVSVTAGNEEAEGAFRYGGEINENWNYRLFGNYRNFDDSQQSEGGDASDGWSMSQMGFRLDGSLDDNNNLTVQGDVYSQESSQVFYSALDPVTLFTVSNQDIEQSGFNILARWNHTNADGSGFSLQSYIDQTSRKEVLQDEERTTLDLDFQYEFVEMGRHSLMVGGGYRQHDHSTKRTSIIDYYPADENFSLSNLFVQDDISFYDGDVHLLLGVKAEKNDYTDVEYQPSLRVSWQINPGNMFWAAASKAVRLPTRVETESMITGIYPPSTLVPLPVILTVSGNPRVRAEELRSYELGFRSRLSEDTTLDLTVFHNDYDDLLLAEPAQAPYFILGCPPGYPCPPLYPIAVVVPLTFYNEPATGSNDILGAEVLLHKNIRDKLSLKLGYTYTNTRFSTNAVAGAPVDPGTLSRNAMNQATFEANYYLNEKMTIDFAYKYVDEIEEMDVDKYNMLNLGFHWQIRTGITFSLVGKNLLHKEHLEYRPEVFLTQEATIQRSYYAKLDWTF